MCDRLQELLQQRALLQSHLAWLDREIAAASGPIRSSPADAVASPANKAPASSPALLVPPQPGGPSASQASPATQAADTQADEILAQYRVDTTSVRTDVRKGCLLYFFGAFLLLGLLLTVFYFLRPSRRASDSNTGAAPSAAPVER